jgi:hypothetical protein
MMNNVTRHHRRRTGRRSILLIVAFAAVIALGAVLAASVLIKPTRHDAARHDAGTVEATTVNRPTHGQGPAPVVKVDLGTLAPADTDFGLLLPASMPDAWRVVTGLADPRLQLTGWAPQGDVAIVGYLSTTDTRHAADAGWPAADAVVLVATSGPAATKLAAAAQAVPGRRYTATASGAEVLLTGPSTNAAELLAGPRLSSDPHYAATIRHSGTGHGTLWVDGHAWLASFSAAAPAAGKAYLTELAAAAPAGNSYWVGAANDSYDYSGSWIGGPSPSVLAAPAGSTKCPPTAGACGGLSSVAPTDPAFVSAQAAQAGLSSAQQGSSATLTVQLGQAQNFFGLGGPPPYIASITLTRAGDGSLGVKLGHS